MSSTPVKAESDVPTTVFISYSHDDRKQARKLAAGDPAGDAHFEKCPPMAVAGDSDAQSERQGEKGAR